VFASPQSPSNVASIFDLNPFMTGADFNPKALHRLNIDSDGEVQADAALQFVFSDPNAVNRTGE
jgi:hypothetical protein